MYIGGHIVLLVINSTKSPVIPQVTPVLLLRYDNYYMHNQIPRLSMHMHASEQTMCQYGSVNGKECPLIRTLRSDNFTGVSTECFSFHQGESVLEMLFRQEVQIRSASMFVCQSCCLHILLKTWEIFMWHCYTNETSHTSTWKQVYIYMSSRLLHVQVLQSSGKNSVLQH